METIASFRLDKKNTWLLNTGATASVFKTVFEGEPVVAKRIASDRNSVLREIAAYQRIAELNMTDGVFQLKRVFRDNRNSTYLLFDDQTSKFPVDINEYLAARQKVFRVPIALAIFARLVSIVDGLLGAKIVHGDIKLENILFDPVDRDIRLIDFGASFLDVDTTEERIIPCCGTLAYLPAEFAKVDGKTTLDATLVYSLGVTLYGMLHYDLPFESPEERANYRGPIRMRRNLEFPVVRLLTGMLKRKPKDRMSFVDVKRFLVKMF